MESLCLKALSCTQEKDRSSYLNNETKEMERGSNLARFLLTQNWLLLVTTTSFTILAGFSVGVVCCLYCFVCCLCCYFKFILSLIAPTFINGAPTNSIVTAVSNQSIYLVEVPCNRIMLSLCCLF